MTAPYSKDNLQDYRKEDFENDTQNLVQQAIYTHNRVLARPWDLYEALKPGTLIHVSASTLR